MKKVSLMLIVLLAACLIAIVGCGGGGGGGGSDDGTGGVVFRINGHQLYLVDLACANNCADMQCIIDNCVEPVNDNQLCLGDAIGFAVTIQNDNLNTTELWYEIIVEGQGKEGPYNFVIDWLVPEQIGITIAGNYQYELEFAGNHEIHVWLKNAKGENSEVYVADVLVNARCPRAALSMSRSATAPIDEKNTQLTEEEDMTLRHRIGSMGYDAFMEDDIE